MDAFVFTFWHIKIVLSHNEINWTFIQWHARKLDGDIIEKKKILKNTLPVHVNYVHVLVNYDKTSSISLTGVHVFCVTIKLLMMRNHKQQLINWNLTLTFAYLASLLYSSTIDNSYRLTEQRNKKIDIQIY